MKIVSSQALTRSHTSMKLIRNITTDLKNYLSYEKLVFSKYIDGYRF